MILRERFLAAEAKLEQLSFEFGDNFRLKKLTEGLYAESKNGHVFTAFRMQKARKRYYKALGVITDGFTLKDAVAMSSQFAEQLTKNGFIDDYLFKLQKTRQAIYTLDDLAYDRFISSEVDFDLTESISLKDLNRIQGLYQNHIQPVLGNTPVHSIDGSMIELLFKRIRAKAVDSKYTYCATANKALEVMQMLLNRAKRFSLVHNNVATLFKARDAGYVDSYSREALMHDQLELLIKKLEEAKKLDPVNVICIYLLILLGPRKGDLIQAKQDDFSPAIASIRGVKEGDVVWNLTTQKNGTKRAQYITPFVRRLLDELKEYQGTSNYLFPARKKCSSQPFISPSTPNRFIKRIVPELDKVIHELRHTCRTLLSYLEVADNVADSYIMQSKKRYRHNSYHLYTKRKEAAIKLSDLIEELINKANEEKE